MIKKPRAFATLNTCFVTRTILSSLEKSQMFLLSGGTKQGWITLKPRHFVRKMKYENNWDLIFFLSGDQIVCFDKLLWFKTKFYLSNHINLIWKNLRKTHLNYIANFNFIVKQFFISILIFIL